MHLVIILYFILICFYIFFTYAFILFTLVTSYGFLFLYIFFFFIVFFFFLMIRLPPRTTRTDTLFPYTTLFRSQADRCLSRVRGLPAGDGRLPAAAGIDQLPRPLSRKPGDRHRDRAGQCARIPVRPAQRQPHHPAGAPPDGAGAVDTVPALRPQPADLRAEHLFRQTGGLPQGDPADLAFARGGELYRAAGALRPRYQTSSSTRGLPARPPPTPISTTRSEDSRVGKEGVS